MLATYTQAYAATQAASPSASSRTFTLRSYFQVLGLRITRLSPTALSWPTPRLTSGSQIAAGGNYWLLTAVRGHFGGHASVAVFLREAMAGPHRDRHDELCEAPCRPHGSPCVVRR